MCPLKEIDPLNHNGTQLLDTLHGLQRLECMNRSMHSSCHGPELPMSMEGTSATRLQLASCCHQDDKTAQACQRSCHTIRQPLARWIMSTLWLSNAFRPSPQNVQDEQTQQQLYNNGLPDRIICYSEAELLIGDLEFHVCVEVEIDGLALR